MSASLLILLVVAGCSSSAPDYRGRWKPVNRFAASTTAIPLSQPYVFYASPMDGTLKAMLSRWAKDTGIKLSYQLSSDYTLSTAASQIHSSELRKAVSELNVILAAQGVSIAVSDWQITVQPLASTASGTAQRSTPADAGLSTHGATK